jgi:putative ABC transport system permease protein
MLGAIVLGMMTTPLQLNAHINKVSRQTTKYDYQIRDGKQYSKDFAYNYFLLNGNKYTEPIQGTTILVQAPSYEKIAPVNLETFINELKNGSNWKQPTYLSKPLYLAIDQLMSDYVANSDLPSDLPESWTQILDPATLTPELSPTAKQYIDDLGTNLADLINVYAYLGQQSSNQNLVSLNLEPFGDQKTQILQLIIDDLKQDLTNSQLGFTSTQQLYIANNFLKVNMTNYAPITSLNELTIDKLADLTSLNLTGISTFDVNFWSLVAPEQNSVNAYLLTNIFHNSDNKNAVNQNGQLAFSLITAVEYTLAQNKPGLLTPEFSVDIRTVDPDASVNQLILRTGRFPNWSYNGVPEVVLSSGFMEKNNFKIGELIYLPASAFGDRVDKGQDLTSWITGNKIQFQIVGTGERYDELTPGSGFTSFAQDFKTYTYAYLPTSFTGTYKKASFIYGASDAKSYTSLLRFRIKNNQTSLIPSSAFDINFVTSESIFANSPTLMKSLTDL